MKFDARHDPSPEAKAAFTAWLTTETASTFQRSSGDSESLKAFVFLSVNRAHGAGLTSSEAAKIIGISVARAALSPAQEELVYDYLEFFAPIAAAAHAKRGADQK